MHLNETRFLYYCFSVYCNPFKELFLYLLPSISAALLAAFVLKSGCKGRHLSNTNQTFKGKICRKTCYFAFLYKRRTRIRGRYLIIYNTALADLSLKGRGLFAITKGEMAVWKRGDYYLRARGRLFAHGGKKINKRGDFAFSVVCSAFSLPQEYLDRA